MIKRLKDKRGVSMAEMIIAMTIITLVTAAAMTIMISSLRTTNRDFSEANAQHFAANVVACYTASTDVEDFRSKMESIGGYVSADHSGEDTSLYYLNGDYRAIVQVTSANLSLFVFDDKDTSVIKIENLPKGVN